jgi:glycosyltransferase involved in cell wall biosynthesis
MATKRVLILTYYWPPSGGAGVQRWLKFAKYLPQHGWKPVVFVPEGANYPALDPKLESDVSPSIDIWKGPIVEPASWLDTLKLVRQQNRFGSSSKSAGSKKSGGLVQWIRGNVFIPDARMFWVRPSVRRLKKRLREHPVDAIVSTGPPHSTHLIALGLKKSFPHIPWVADFRDPWSDMDYLDDFNLTARSRARHKALEQEVVSVADRVVVTAPSAATSLLGRPLEPNDPKGVWIPNGFDVDDGFDLPPASAEGPLVIGFFGSLYGSRNAPGFWRAIRDHNADPTKRRIQLVVYGALDPSIRSELEGTLTPESWEFRGSVAHEQVPQAMSQCHALVILQNNNDTGRRTIPGKAFEYLATGRPLIAGGALDSDLERLLQSWGFGMCGMEDDAGFARQIEHALAGRASSISPERFQRDALALDYSELLHKLGA